MHLPTINDVRAAASRLEGKAVRTPLIYSEALSDITGASVFVKPENLQRTGSFKFRGAYNAISSLSAEDRDRGIVAASSGNHAQGVAMAAKLLGSKSTILMPADAPAIKRARTKRSGSDIVEYDRSSGDREGIFQEIVTKTGSVPIHPFNNVDVIAGQGTVGLEIAEDFKRIGVTPDRMLVCTGGGGLTAGVAVAMTNAFPDLKLHCVEPAGFDDYKRSIESGSICSNEKNTGSICDAVISPQPGEIGFEINKKLLHSGLVVTDQEALAAIKFAFEELKLVAEPGGAVALAAALKYGREWEGQTLCLTISGGNVDPDIFSKALGH